MNDFFNPDLLDEADAKSGDGGEGGQPAASSGENDNGAAGGEDNGGEGGGQSAAGNQPQGGEGGQPATSSGENNNGAAGGEGNGGEGGGQPAAGDQPQGGEGGQPAAAEQKSSEDDIEKKVLSSLLKKFGVTSEDELQRKLNPETEEQKQQRLEALKAGVNKYAVEKGYLKNADIIRLENLRSTPKEQLVFNEFATQYKEKFKDRKDEMGDAKPVTDDEVKDEFNKTYHVNSENPIQKQIGEQMIEDQSKKLIGELEDKYKQIEDEFKDFSFRKEKSKQYFSFVDGFISENMPKEFSYGDGENKITYQFDSEKFSAKDREDLKKFFINDSDFENFIDGGVSQKLLGSFKEKMEKFLKLTHHDRIVDTVAKVRYEAGLKAGSATGAKAPFKQTDQEMKPVEVKDNELTDAEKQELADSGMFGGQR